MGRIEKNEKRLDSLLDISTKLESDLELFENLINDYYLLNKYYGSNEWFKDKDDLEKGKINNIKAGVLSEDAVWNLNEDVSDIIERMDLLVKQFREKNKNLSNR